MVHSRIVTRAVAAAASLLISAGMLQAAAVTAEAMKPRGYSIQKTTDGGVPRWNPCAGPFTVAVSTPALKGRQAKVAVREAKWAVGQLKKYSGLPFTFAGRTDEVPRGGTQVASANVVISYSTPKLSPGFGLQSSAVGIGGSWIDYTLARFAGYVVIDVPQARRLKAGQRGGYSRSSVALHELGHVVGLDHVGLRSEIMYPAVAPFTPRTFGRGDRAGLKKVGAKAGCL